MKIIILSLLCIGIFHSNAQSTFEKTYGVDSFHSFGLQVFETANGDLLLTGSRNTLVNGIYDILLIKVDAQGKELWSKTFAIGASSVGASFMTTDEGLVVTGIRQSKIYILKIGPNGDSLWIRDYTNGNRAESIIQTKDGDLIVAGENYIGTNRCCTPVLFKTNADGTNPSSIMDYPGYDGRVTDVKETSDGNLLVSFSRIEGHPPIPYLRKINKVGNKLWEQSYAYYCDCRVAQADNDHWILYGENIKDFKPYLIKVDNSGNEIWNKNSTIHYVRLWWKVFSQTRSTNFAVTGGSRPDNESKYLAISKTDQNGTHLWTKTFGGSRNQLGRSVIETSDGGYAALGSSNSFRHGNWELYLIKTNSNGELVSIQNFALDNKVINVVPNPNDGKFHISGVSGTAQIMDYSGKVVWEGIIGDEGMEMGSSMLPGTYVIRAGGSVERFVLNR